MGVKMAVNTSAIEVKRSQYLVKIEVRGSMRQLDFLVSGSALVVSYSMTLFLTASTCGSA
jgi:hypothetical protein